MLEYIKGVLVDANPQKAVIDVNGLGYGLLIPLSTYSNLPQIGETILLYISSVIREDSHRHFGFLSLEERSLFEMVHDVSGIGPKTALALIGHLDSSDLESAIVHANVSLLSKIPGIGKKTAERLIVEMRDKIHKRLKSVTPSIPIKGKDHLTNDAMSALMNLGYNTLRAQQAVKNALSTYDEPPPLSELIGSALKGIGSK